MRTKVKIMTMYFMALLRYYKIKKKKLRKPPAYRVNPYLKKRRFKGRFFKDAQSTDEKMCIIQACQSHSIRTPDLEYYPIPNQLNTRKTWIRLILAHTKHTDIPHNAFICSLHFAQDCFRVNPQNQNKILLANAVPSIFPPPEAAEDDFPSISPQDLTDPVCGKKFYEWSLKKYHEQKKQIQALRQKNSVQGKRIARLAKSVDDFKAKRYISDEANSALQNLFDKIIDAQYEVV